MSGLGDMVDFGELVRRAVKYLVEGIMVAIAAYAIPKKPGLVLWRDRGRSSAETHAFGRFDRTTIT